MHAVYDMHNAFRYGALQFTTIEELTIGLDEFLKDIPIRASGRSKKMAMSMPGPPVEMEENAQCKSMNAP